MAARLYQARERRLLSEYLAIARPGARIVLNARLGPQAFRVGGTVPAGVDPRIFSNTQMYADAAVIKAGAVELWEAKAVLDGRAIGQLLEYQLALAQSPDYVEFRSLPATLHIVAAVARPTALALADKLGIEVKLYAPAWITADFANWYANTQSPIAPASASVKP